jgi:hypothetical protein
MAAFYTGAPTSVPEDKSECVYGRWGRVGRAIRDVPDLGRHETLGEILVVAVTAVSAGAFFIVQARDSDLGRILTVLEGVVVGLVVAGVLLFLWGLRPWAWKRHWVVSASPFSDDSSSHTGLFLKSRHWHTVLNVRCSVRDPDGTWWSAIHPGQVILAPGANAAGFEYPNDFGAPWPGEGRYRLSFQTDVMHGDKPVRLARKRWKIDQIRPAPAETVATSEPELPDHRDHLADWFTLGQRLADEKVRDDDELSSWTARYQSWAGSVSRDLKQNVSAAEAALFDDTSNLMAADIIGTYDTRHNNLRLRLDRHLKNLADLLKRQ